MKVLFVPYGTEKAPATRYRVMQYLPYLRGRGIDYTVFSAISSFSTTLMVKSPDFNRFSKLLYYLYVFIEKLVRLSWIIFISGKFDIVFLQRTTFPFRLETLLRMANNNIIFDIDDAIYLPDKQGNDIVTRLKKYIKKNEVINILKVSKSVITENDYIKNFVSQYCESTYKIPGPIDTERFSAPAKGEKQYVTLGWIGTPGTTSYLYMLDNVFKRIAGKYSFVKFKFIGVGRYKNPGIKIERVKWDYMTEVDQLQSFDIGIMPMPDDEWTRGKLGCKMLQYMSVGVPAVVSYTPTNVEIIRNGENGFFTTRDQEWTEVLSRLIEDKDLRNAIGRKGRETIVDKCSLTGNIDRLIDIFKKLKK